MSGEHDNKQKLPVAEQVSFLDTLIFGRHKLKSPWGQMRTVNNDAFILRNKTPEKMGLGEGWEALRYDDFSSYENKAEFAEDAPEQWYVFVVDGWADYNGKAGVALAYAQAMGMCGLIPDDMRSIAVIGDTLVPADRMDEELGKHGLVPLTRLDFNDGAEHPFNPLFDDGYIRKRSNNGTLVLWKGVSEDYTELFPEKQLIAQHYIDLCMESSYLLGKETYTYEEVTRKCFEGEFIAAMAHAIDVASFGTQSLPEAAIREAAPRNPADRKRIAESPLRKVLFVPEEGPAREIAEITATRWQMMTAWRALASAAHLKMLPLADGLPQSPDFLVSLMEDVGLTEDFKRQLTSGDANPLLDKISGIRGPMMEQPTPEQRESANDLYEAMKPTDGPEYETRELEGKPSGACEVIAAIESSLNPSKLGFKATAAPVVSLFACDSPAHAQPVVTSPCHDFPKVCEIYNELFSDDGWSLIVAPPMPAAKAESLGLCAVALGLVPEGKRKLVVAAGHWELLPDWEVEGWAERFEDEGIEVIGDVDGVLEDYGFTTTWEDELIEERGSGERSRFVLRDGVSVLPEVAKEVSKAFPARLLSAFQGPKLPFFSYDVTEPAMNALSCGHDDGGRLYPDEDYTRIEGKAFPYIPMEGVFPLRTGLVEKTDWANTAVEYRDLIQLWDAALEPFGMALAMETRHRFFGWLPATAEICGVESYLDAYYMGIPVDELVM